MREKITVEDQSEKFELIRVERDWGEFGALFLRSKKTGKRVQGEELDPGIEWVREMEKKYDPEMDNAANLLMFRFGRGKFLAVENGHTLEAFLIEA
jgi:hypothetical protein